jgi:hypothetical protein
VHRRPVALAALLKSKRFSGLIERKIQPCPKGPYERPDRSLGLLGDFRRQYRKRVPQVPSHRGSGAMIRGFPLTTDYQVDAVFLPDGSRREDASVSARELTDATVKTWHGRIRGRDAVILHTATALGMSVMGLALFSFFLFEERIRTASLHSFALCTTEPADLKDLLDPYDGRIAHVAF